MISLKIEKTELLTISNQLTETLFQSSPTAQYYQEQGFKVGLCREFERDKFDNTRLTVSFKAQTVHSSETTDWFIDIFLFG
jgi:hypothetical protein